MIKNQSVSVRSAAAPRTFIEEAARGGVLLIVGLAWPALIHLIPTDLTLGPILMPLMLPVALGAFILPRRTAMAVACLMPFVSLSLTGMPPLPIALQLAAEGLILVLVAGYLVKMERPWWMAFASGAIASRLAAWGILVIFMQSEPTGAGLVIGQGFAGLAVSALLLPLLIGSPGKTSEAGQ